jgi:hypothetical protein
MHWTSCTQDNGYSRQVVKSAEYRVQQFAGLGKFYSYLFFFEAGVACCCSVARPNQAFVRHIGNAPCFVIETATMHQSCGRQRLEGKMWFDDMENAIEHFEWMHHRKGYVQAFKSGMQMGSGHVERIVIAFWQIEVDAYKPKTTAC